MKQLLRATCALHALWLVAGQVSGGGGGSWGGGSWGSSSSSSSFWDGLLLATILGRPTTKGENAAEAAVILVVVVLILGVFTMWQAATQRQMKQDITDPGRDVPYPGGELPAALKKLHAGEWIWLGSYREGSRKRKFQITTFEFDRQTCRVLGRGQDKYGPFSIQGRVIQRKGQLNFVKQYDDQTKDALVYFGTFETSGEKGADTRVNGNWCFMDSDSLYDGFFHMKTGPSSLKDTQLQDVKQDKQNQLTIHAPDILDSLV